MHTIQPRRVTWLAWTLWASYLLLQTMAVVLAFLVRSYPQSATSLSVLSRLLLYLPAFTAFATVGALIASRQPHNPIGWLFLATGWLTALGGLAEGYWRYALFVQPGALPAGQLMLWVNTRLYPISVVPLLLVVLLFPTGHPPTRRWWLAGWVILLGSLLLHGAFAFLPGTLDPSVTIPNPLALAHAAGFLQRTAETGVVLLVVGVLGTTGSMLMRLHRAQGIERQQLKTLAYALVIYAAATGSILAALRPSEEPSPLITLLFIVQALAAAGVAVATGLAILRYRLFDIDVIIRRTLQYSILTVILALVYWASVVLLQSLFRSLSGESPHQLITVVSTLAIAALFTPVRRRVQAELDRRFYRRKYNTEQVLASFGATVRNETELERLNAELLQVVNTTMQPAQVSLWLRPAKAEGKSGKTLG